jgi:CheY-like chemotaxis protein
VAETALLTYAAEARVQTPQPHERGLLDGYGVAKRIRGQPWGQRITLVALTGWGQDFDRRRSREAGFDSHLVKPLDLDTLADLLARLPSGPGQGRTPSGGALSPGAKSSAA